MTKIYLLLLATLLSGCANRIYEVNEEINAYKYIPDSVDYLKTPKQFYADGGGDCEDFANAKKAILGGELVYMPFLIGGTSHIVLKVDGYLLDSRSNHIMSASWYNTFPFKGKERDGA